MALTITNTAPFLEPPHWSQVQPALLAAGAAWHYQLYLDARSARPPEGFEHRLVAHVATRIAKLKAESADLDRQVDEAHWRLADERRIPLRNRLEEFKHFRLAADVASAERSRIQVGAEIQTHEWVLKLTLARAAIRAI